MDRIKALMVLEECTGHDIWSVEHCRQRGVPEDWIEEMVDAHESSFFSDRATIYVDERSVNQYRGVHDLKLAMKIAKQLGIDVERYASLVLDRGNLVRALKEAVEEG